MEYGRTAFFCASRNGHKEIVQMLLETTDIDINQQDKLGLSVLMLASLNGHKEIVRIFLEKNEIDVNLPVKIKKKNLSGRFAEYPNDILQLDLREFKSTSQFEQHVQSQ